MAGITKRFEPSVGELISLEPEARAALELHAPHVCDATNGRVLSFTLRALVISVQDKVVIKRGISSIKVEESNMRFVARRFSLPVPKVFGLYTGSSDRVFLVMEFIDGQPMRLAWPELQETEKEQVSADLKASVGEMRLATASFIGTVDKQAFPEGQGILEYPQTGPFDTEEEFNEALLKRFNERFEYHTPVFREMLNQNCGHKIVFAHGDLQMKNILVHKGRISAIVDWEHAGFYPEYWDYAVARDVHVFLDPELEDYPAYLQRYLDPYAVEAAVIELISSKICSGY